MKIAKIKQACDIKVLFDNLSSQQHYMHPWPHLVLNKTECVGGEPLLT